MFADVAWDAGQVELIMVIGILVIVGSVVASLMGKAFAFALFAVGVAVCFTSLLVA